MKHSVENVSMKKCIKIFNGVLFLLCTSILPAQNLPMEAWRTHFSYNAIEKMIYGNEKLFCITENGLFYIDLTDESLNIFTKLDGLSDANPTAMAYSESEKALVLGYESGLIDIVQNGKITTIDDVQNSSLAGEKTIYDITIAEGIAYLGSGFGVLVIPLSSKEIAENYRSIGRDGEDLEARELLTFNGQLYVITNKGVQFGSMEENLLDFNNWTIIYTEELSLSALTATDSHPCLVANDTTILSLAGDTIAEVSVNNENPILDMLSENGSLYVLTAHQVRQLEEGVLKTVASIDQEATVFFHYNGFWIGTASEGLKSPSGAMLLPNGPLSDAIFRIRFMNGKLYVFYGPEAEDYTNGSDQLGYNYFDNVQWEYETIDGFYNLTDIALYQGRLYFASAGYGVYDLTDQSVLAGLPGNSVIPELAALDHLYIPVYGTGQGLWMMDADRVLTSYSTVSIGTSAPVGIDVSQGGSVWLRTSGNGISVFNHESEEYRLITSSDNLPSSTINSVAIDLSDAAWIATAAGIAVLADATYVFDEYEASIPVYNNEVLFEAENVSAVTVDGGNRIWMGTDKGLWIFDNDINELQHHFTAANSPLPSDEILQLAYNPANGEMFILTGKGLVSYRSSSSLAMTKHSRVSIFPNPVRPGYEGLVGISGLARDASVKITDINGKLMREVQANGGTASWDLKDYNQRKVPSGIYVLFSSSSDGEETHIGKIAVVR